MAWATPRYTPQEVNAAGRKLATMEFPVIDTEGLEALDVLNNWRSSHAYPLNTFQMTLRIKARKIDKQVIVAQRSKRLDSIHKKLINKPTLRMTKMQDIAGCRAIFSNLNDVYSLAETYKSSRFDHKFRSEKDYIYNPKSDGYRCYHIMYDYFSNKDNSVYNGHRIEIQIRTQLQHAWATAVEAVGIFTRQALKSNQGDEDWLRFFALMGSAIATIEKTPIVPNTPADKEDLVSEIKSLTDKLHVKDMLQVYNTTIKKIGSSKDEKYFIIEMDPDKK